MKLNLNMRKHWWVIIPIIIGLVLLFTYKPVGLFSAYPLSEKGARIVEDSYCTDFSGHCFDQAAGMYASIENKLKGNTMLKNCDIVNGICKCDTVFNAKGCSEYVYEIDTEGAKIPTTGTISAGDTADTAGDTIGATVKVVCSGNKLYYASDITKVYDNCGDRGCTIEEGVHRCMTEKEASTFSTGKASDFIKKNWIYFAIGIFFLILLSMMRSDKI